MTTSNSFNSTASFSSGPAAMREKVSLADLTSETGKRSAHSWKFHPSTSSFSWNDSSSGAFFSMGIVMSSSIVSSARKTR